MVGLDSTEKDFLISKIELSIKECLRHIKWVNYALYNLKIDFPITLEQFEIIKREQEQKEIDFVNSDNDYSKLDNSEVEFFDQFVYRYSKLQDKIAQSIIKPICDLLEYNTETVSFIDYLNIAEKNCVIESIEQWNALRTVRNSITHDYEDDIEYQVKIINNVYNACQELLKIFYNINDKFDNIKSRT